MNLDNRQTRRMLERMGVSMEQIDGVEEVIIRTADKDLVIKKANVSEMKMKDSRMFQVIGDDVEERMREKPKFTREDVLLVAQQANVSEPKAEQALKDSDGDLAQAILRLSSLNFVAKNLSANFKTTSSQVVKLMSHPTSSVTQKSDADLLEKIRLAETDSSARLESAKKEAEAIIARAREQANISVQQAEETARKEREGIFSEGRKSIEAEIQKKYDQRKDNDVEAVVCDRESVVELQFATHPVRRSNSPVQRGKYGSYELLEEQAHSEGSKKGFER